jgi:hypothetical protein
LAISNDSTPPSFVPTWNSFSPTYLDTIFNFAATRVHNSRAVIFFHADSLKINADLKGYLKACDFKIFKEWMGINRLRLTSIHEQFQMVNNL